MYSLINILIFSGIIQQTGDEDDDVFEDPPEQNVQEPPIDTSMKRRTQSLSALQVNLKEPQSPLNKVIVVQLKKY